MKRHRWTVVIALVAAIVLAAGAAAYATYVWNQHTAVTVQSAAVTAPEIKVSGSISGLVPEAHQQLTVTVSNSNEFAVRLTKISGGSAATTSGCPAWAVRVVPPDKDDPGLRVRAGSTATVHLQVQMEKWADQRCAGQTFTLDLFTSATAG